MGRRDREPLDLASARAKREAALAAAQAAAAATDPALEILRTLKRSEALLAASLLCVACPACKGKGHVAELCVCRRGALAVLEAQGWVTTERKEPAPAAVQEPTEAPTA